MTSNFSDARLLFVMDGEQLKFSMNVFIQIVVLRLLLLSPSLLEPILENLFLSVMFHVESLLLQPFRQLNLFNGVGEIL